MHLVRVVHQRELLAVRIVRKTTGAGAAFAGLALKLYEFDVVVHLEAGFVRVRDLPNDNRRDLDRISDFVVHFKPFTVQSPGS